MTTAVSLALWALLGGGTWIGFVGGVKGISYLVSFVVCLVIFPLALVCVSVALFDTPTSPLPPPSSWRWAYRAMAAGVLAVLVWSGAQVTGGVFAVSLVLVHLALYLASCPRS